MALVRPRVNADVLQWARRCRNLPRKTAAERLKVSEARVIAWESGEEFPTVGQLRNMAKVYRKPFAALFTDEPPEPLDQLPDLRRFFHVLNEEGAEVLDMLPDLADAVGEAFARRDLYIELAVGAQRFEVQIDPDEDMGASALHIRNAIGISWGEQSSCRNANKARRLWSSLLERAGVLVFQFTAPLEQARGFSVRFDHAPIVAVNSGDSEYGRVFSLVHELVHVCLPHEHSLDARACEQLCNGVAGRVLVPERRLSEALVGHGGGGHGFESLSKEFGVSQEVIARRLLDMSAISPERYDAFRRAQQRISAPKRRGGGNYYATRKTQLGEAYISTVFEALSDRRLTLAGAGRAFEMKPLNVEKFREHILKGLQAKD